MEEVGIETSVMTVVTTNRTKPAPSGRTTEPGASLTQRRPMKMFLLFAFGIGWPLLGIPAIMGIPTEPFLLGLVFIALLAPALLVTRAADGPGAIGRLFSRALIWRFGVGRWAVILFGVPVLTVAFAAASGTLDSPDGGWLGVAVTYLVSTLIVGALILNVWEETAWGGFAQSRLMARHGLLVGSLLTAPLFAAIHIPLLFESGWTWSEVGAGLAILVVGAPFYRYLLGMHLLDTKGSILAIGIQHAAWNASGNLDGVRGEWQVITAVAMLTLSLAVARRMRSPSRVHWERRPKRPQLPTGLQQAERHSPADVIQPSSQAVDRSRSRRRWSSSSSR